MAMTTGVLPGSSAVLPPFKTLNSFARSTAVLSWIDAKHGNSLGYSLSPGVRYERVKKYRALSFPSSPSGDLRPDIDENPEGILSGEWPENFSLLSYDDLRAYLETQITNERMKPSALLGEVMSTTIRTATPDQTLEEVDHYFEVVSGLPVIDENLRCIGVVSKKDKAKASKGLKSKVGEVMSSPALTLSPDKTVLDAAALMLKKKVHRIPILDEKHHVIGIVTRTDVFQALETAEV
ncbi:uncharacterized protein LOC110030484 [Phalaenopsis equestris]|uniref:uncharacterized protein LOC110030484 n=1 Tax=Phalaenopsis equestris TaxID=78828 RepID=UPI0009E30485|nr:uncharacterized protein LOC110030484 [Phalaenopsis equestris]